MNHFNEEVMVNMLNDGYSPIEATIEKWEVILRLLQTNNIEDAIDTDSGKSNCALCYKHDHDCRGCPIKLHLLKIYKGKVRGRGCLHTPYVPLTNCFWHLIGLKNTNHPDKKYWKDEAIQHIKLGLEMLYKIKEDYNGIN